MAIHSTDFSDVTEALLLEILAGCEGVTAGPWATTIEQVGIANPDRTAYVKSADALIVATTKPGRVENRYAITADYIARLDPQTVSSIVGMALNWLRRPAPSNEAVELPAWFKGDLDSYKIMYEATPEQIEASLQKQRDALTTLPKNWDGYGADPLPAQIVDDLLADITVEGGVVDLVPGADGSIQAEWHRRGNVDIEYNIDANGKRALYVKVSPRLALSASPAPDAGAVALPPDEFDALKDALTNPVTPTPSIIAGAELIDKLYAAPPHPPAEVRNAVIEECAKAAEAFDGRSPLAKKVGAEPDWHRKLPPAIAASIRALAQEGK